VLTLIPQFRNAPPALTATQPITIGSANKLLANTSSWESVSDDAGFAFRTASAQTIPKYRSALDFLSQEDLSK